jgi:hypothetical protein
MANETRHIYRCDRCGALTYPLQRPDGTIDHETPDVSTVTDTDYMGHRWILGLWESWQYRGTEGAEPKDDE